MQRIALCVTILALVATSFAAEYVCTPDHQPTRSGIPLGGMGCGTVEIRGDGAFHEWQIFNNMCRPAYVPDALFAARVKVGGQQTACALQLTPPEELPGVDQIVYRGEFPYAWLKYDLPGDLPVELRMEAFTPFIPHDAEASALPAAVFRIVLENDSPDPATARVAFFMPPAMNSAGAGATVSVHGVSSAGLTGATISTKTGDPARTAKPVRVLVISDNGDRGRIPDILSHVRGIAVAFAPIKNDRVVLPASADELRKKYDVIWLAELGRARDRLGPDGMALIRDAVKAGCGFVYTGGWDSLHGHDPGRWAKLDGTPIEEILPFTILDRWDAIDRRVRAKVVKVPDALKHADLRHFPGAGGYNAIKALKPGAQVVLQTRDGKPLLVLGTFAKGRVAAYLSTPFGGWPRPWGGWPAFYGSLVAYAAGTSFIPATGTAPDHPAAGSITVAAVGKATVRRWSDLRAAWDQFASYGDFSSASDGPGVAVMCTINAPPKGRGQSRFILSWYFPNHKDRRGHLDGHHYATVFSSSEEVAAKLTSRLEDLSRRTRRFHDALYNTPMPYWLADAINAQFSTFTKASWWDAKGRFGIWEGMNCCCGLHTVDVSFYGSWPLLMMFPELQKDALRRTAQFQRESDGRIPHLFAGTFDAIDNYGRIDLPIQFILPVYREYLFTGDLDFLKELWPACRDAANSVFLLDKNNDGLPEHTRPGDQTYDGWAIMGESAYIGNIWLAGLRAMEEMAKALGDKNAAADYRAAYEKARDTYERLLWNGTYYRLWQDPNTGKKDEGLMLDAMCGQWYAHMLGLGWILPRDRVLSHLRACIKYNRIPIQRGMAYMVGDSGMCYVNCSWPGGKQHIGGQAGSPWTGTEYAFASLCIYSGLVDEGLRVVKDVYDRYYDAGMTWNHIECGSHYFRPMDIWTVLMALEGLRWDAPRGVLQISMAQPDKKFRGPIVLPQAWGILNWEPGHKKPLDIDWLEGNIKISRLAAPTR